jgi:hypothetical protein
MTLPRAAEGRIELEARLEIVSELLKSGRRTLGSADAGCMRELEVLDERLLDVG